MTCRDHKKDVNRHPSVAPSRHVQSWSNYNEHYVLPAVLLRLDVSEDTRVILVSLEARCLSHT